MGDGGEKQPNNKEVHVEELEGIGELEMIELCCVKFSKN